MKDFFSIIKRPLITEKVTALREAHNRYGFEVAGWANKHQIKQAVESVFKVKVLDVTTMNVRGKVKRLGRTQGRRPDWKKAIVTLAKDNKIELIEGI
jgi:large subunit ribosomal protein L23